MTGTTRLDAELAARALGWHFGALTAAEYDARGEELCDQADADAAITRHLTASPDWKEPA